MIVSVEEVLRLKEIAESTKKKLMEEQVPIGNVELGIMIETPAAAILSDQLAEHVDFFSIGTNDLAQYTLAADRQNPRLSQIVNPHHPAVLRLIEMTVQNGHKAGIPVGICGELAADSSLTGVFLDMGVDELSVAPSLVLEIRQAVLSY
jgi:phosphotransferase system enzyme I (PtsI)